jgi:ubiquinone/menaquinone biosynthesis C-methylase UbiE
MSRIDYDTVAEHYDRSRRFDSDFTRELLAGLPQGFAPRRALDAGCGTGNATACLREAFQAAGIAGLDLSAGMLSRARVKHPGLPLVRGDAAALPFADGVFDLVLSTYMLHHLNRPGEFCAEAARCLAPGGRLVLLTASHAQISAHFLIRFFPRFGHLDCARFPSLDDLEAELEAAGLVPVARREIPVADYRVDQHYLERVRNKHISTFELMTEEEFATGLAAISEWVNSYHGPEEQRPRHTAHGTLLLAQKELYDL